MPGETLLVDADSFIYEASFASVKTLHIDGNVVQIANEDEARSRIDAALQGLKNKFKAKHLRVFLSDTTRNWRTAVYPDYKGNRKAADRPGCYGALRAHLQTSWKAEVWPTLEGDDCVGITATAPLQAGDGDRIVVSIDKDLQTIPGLHFNPWKSQDGLTTVSEDEAHLFFMRQVLTGDKVDNYPGCPNTGPKKALKILPEDMAAEKRWNAVVAAYRKAKLPESVALAQARVARILRFGEYDRITQKVKLWTPQ